MFLLNGEIIVILYDILVPFKLKPFLTFSENFNFFEFECIFRHSDHIQGVHHKMQSRQAMRVTRWPGGHLQMIRDKLVPRNSKNLVFTNCR